MRRADRVSSACASFFVAKPRRRNCLRSPPTAGRSTTNDHVPFGAFLIDPRVLTCYLVRLPHWPTVGVILQTAVTIL